MPEKKTTTRPPRPPIRFANGPLKFKKIVLFKIIQIIVVLGLGVYFSFFFSQKIDKRSEQLLDNKQGIENIQARNQAESQLYDEYQKARPYLKKVGVTQFLFAEKDIIKIISSLEEIAAETGISQKIQIGKIEPYSAEKEKVEEMNYTLTLGGDYNSFLGYCKKIEDFPYFIEMKDINLSIPLGIGEEGKMMSNSFFLLRKE